MGSAFGGLFGGSLADRIGGKWAILLGVLGGALPIYFYIPVPGAARFALLLLAGFFGGMPHSILVIMVQQLLPGRQALASGLALGFMFFSGAIGSYFLGLIADHAGLAQTLQGTAVLLLVAAGAALFLPKYRNQTNLATA
jgi:predicted MFS family arabinose efflux permease